MYRAYHTRKDDGGEYGPKMFFDVTLQSPVYQIINPKLSMTFGKAGTFTFEVPYENNQYGEFKEFVSYIDLYREDTIIFSGRVLGQTKGFDNIYKITCEGALAYFNDSLAIDKQGNVLEELYFVGDNYSGIRDFMSNIIAIHNFNVGETVYKSFVVGEVLTRSTNESFYVSFSKYSTLMSVLDEFTKQYGGYFYITKNENGENVLNYAQTHTSVGYIENMGNANPNQSIDFGKNLIDLEQETSVDNLVSVVYVEGKDGLTVKVPGDDETDMSTLQNTSELGIIQDHISFSEIDNANTLKELGKKYLEESRQPNLTINASAVDLAKAGSNIKFFEIGQTVRVHSDIHGLDKDLTIQTYEIDLLDPSSGSISLGSEKNGYITRSKTASSNIYNEITNTINNVVGNPTEPLTESDIDRAIQGLVG